MAPGKPTPDYLPLHFIELIRRHFQLWTLYVKVFFGTTIAAAVLSYLLPVEYKSTANLLPSEKQSVGMNLLAGGGLGKMAGSLLKQQNDEIDRFYVLLSSSNVKKKVIRQFNLVKRYGFDGQRDSMMFTMRELDSKTSFKGYEEGNFVIEVWDEDPVVARDMCAFYVDVLNQLNTEIATKEAKNFRMFVEQKYNLAMESLENTAKEMSLFQKKHGVIDLPEQVVENMKLIGALTASQLEAEIKYEIAATSLGEDSEQLRQSKVELNAIRKKTRQVYTDTSKNSILMNFPELPELAKNFMLLKSRLIMNEEILKFALPMYEQAKMEEAKNLPVVTVLDEPEVPTRKDRPKRAFVVLMTTLSAMMLLFFGLSAQFVYERNRTFFRFVFGLNVDEQIV